MQNVKIFLEDAYSGLREEMQNVLIKPGTADYYALFPENLKEGSCLRKIREFLLEKMTQRNLDLFAPAICFFFQFDPNFVIKTWNLLYFVNNLYSLLSINGTCYCNDIFVLFFISLSMKY